MSLTKFLTILSKNKIVQRLLEKNIQISQYFMGIGDAGKVTSSGEEIVFRILTNHCKPPYCIFDVGANKGQYVKSIQNAILHPDFCIHCFEPNKAAYSLLHQTYQEYSNIRLNRLAFGRRKGTDRLYYDKPGSNLASLTKRRLHHFNIHFDQHEDIEVDTIDNYCNENSIDRIHLLKLDVEGHELDVLSGAAAMLEKRCIDIVAFEFGGCNIDTRTFLQDFYYFFSEKLYMKMYRITPSGYLYEIDQYKEIHEQFRTSNFVVIKK